MKLSEPDIAQRVSFECDGCENTFVDNIEKVDSRTCDGHTYCPECWKLGEFESDETSGMKNQIY